MGNTSTTAGIQGTSLVHVQQVKTCYRIHGKRKFDGGQKLDFRNFIMSEWVEVPDYPCCLVRRSVRNRNRVRVDYKRFFYYVKVKKRTMKFMQRSTRTVTISAPPPAVGRDGQLGAGRNAPEEPSRGLKRGRSNEGNSQRRRNQKKRHDEEASHTQHSAGTNQADRNLDQIGVNAQPIPLPNIVQFRVEEGDANIMASAATSPANSICGRRNNRRFPMTPRPRPESFSSDDMSEDHDEQNIFRDAVEVTSSGDARLRQFLVRTTRNVEPSDGFASGTSHPDHSAATPSRGTGHGSQDQQMFPQAPPPFLYPWQLGLATLAQHPAQGFRGKWASFA
ncbi:hypothetical protein Aduo_010455 [Ancylostoma duodenale]